MKYKCICGSEFEAPKSIEIGETSYNVCSSCESTDFKEIQITRIEHDKLVRDKVFQQLQAQGKAFQGRKIKDKQEIIKYLKKKLVEITDNFIENGQIAELIDLQEVLVALVHMSGNSWEIFTEQRVNKTKVSGNYRLCSILEWIEEKK